MKCTFMRLFLCLAVAGLWQLAGCAGQSQQADPLSDIRNPRLSESRRVQSIDRAWAEAAEGRSDKVAVREDLKTIAWGVAFPVTMRMAALRALLSDTDAQFEADTQNMVRLMLPREPHPAVVRALSEASAEKRWTDNTPALVRSLSRSWEIPDEQRPEFRAIAALNPGKSVIEVVYQVFVDPPQDEPAFGLVPAEKVQSDAWDLLARLDVDGRVRTRLIHEASETSGPVADMRASLRDLRTMPVTGDELRWLRSLRSASDPRKGLWWQEASSAVARLDARNSTKLGLRHMEPIRWAAVHRPDWLNAPREQLLAELKGRLEGRTMHRRSRRDRDRIPPAPERLSDWERQLTWADLLTILVIDESLKDPMLRQALFAQAAMDRADTTAEYGGVLRSDADQRPGVVNPFSVVLYPPRPGTRLGDDQFVASTDMIAQSDHALAHYHFHVQTARNSEYAGPSPNDLAYAARQGRNCLVLTSINLTTLNVDYYQPDGAVIDLGEIVQDR